MVKLGQVQATKGSVDEAIATYKKSIQENPNEASFYILLGQLYESKQDWNKAKESYQKALELKPDDPLASNSKGWWLSFGPLLPPALPPTCMISLNVERL